MQQTLFMNARQATVTTTMWANVMAALPNIGGALFSTPQFG